MLCRIPKSQISLSKSQFDAVVDNVSRYGPGKPVSDDVEMHSDAPVQVMARNCATAVVSSCPATTVTSVLSSSVGQGCPEEETNTSRTNRGMHCCTVYLL